MLVVSSVRAAALTELPGQILAAVDWLAQKPSQISISRFVAAEVAAVEIAVAVTAVPAPPDSESEPGFAEVAAVEIAVVVTTASASSVRWRQSPQQA